MHKSFLFSHEFGLSVNWSSRRLNVITLKETLIFPKRLNLFLYNQTPLWNHHQIHIQEQNNKVKDCFFIRSQNCKLLKCARNAVYWLLFPVQKWYIFSKRKQQTESIKDVSETQKKTVAIFSTFTRANLHVWNRSITFE